jgi:hypothetical protein
VFNATFNKISVISWQSVLFVEEPGVHEEDQRHAASRWQNVSHNVIIVVSSTPHHVFRYELTLQYRFGYQLCIL